MDRKVWRLTLSFILLTFLGGVAYSLYLGENLIFYDEKEYYNLAQNIAHKGMVSLDGETPTAWRPPGYPFFLAPWISLGATITSLRILNFATYAFSACLVALLLKPYSTLAGLIGVLMMFCYPVLFFTASTLYPQTLGTTLLLLSIWLLFHKENLSYSSAIGIGAAQGFLTLMIPTFASSVIFTCLWLFTRQIAKPFLKALTIALTAVLILLPWSMRNYLEFNQVVFVSTNGGINLLLGNSPHTRPNSGVNTDLSEYRPSTSFENEFEADKYYRNQALNYIFNNKMESLKLYGLKLLNFFNYQNEMATQSEETPFREMLMLATYGLLVLIAVVRLMFSFRFPLNNFDYYLILSYLFAGAFMAIFFTRIRFRLPYDPLLILLNARFIAWWLLTKFKEA